MKSLQSWKTFVFFIKAYPLRSVFMVAALVVAGFLEGIGIVALLPLVSILTEQTGTINNSAISQIIHRIFDVLGLEVSIGPLLIFIVGAIILKAVITMLAMIQVSYTTSHVCADLRLSLLRNLLNAKWSHFLGIKGGAYANALGTEAQRASFSYRQGCYVLAWGLQVLVYTALAFVISWRLTLAAIAAGSLMAFALGFLVRAGRKAGQEQTKVLDSVLTRITDTLFGAKPLKAMGKIDHLLAMMEEDTRSLQNSQRRMELYIQSIAVFSEPIMVIFLSIGLYGILNYGDLAVTELLFLALLFLRMVMKVANVQSAYLTMAANESALWSMIRKIEAAKNQAEHNKGTITPTLNQSITFNNVSFSYGEKSVLSNTSLSFPSHGFFVIFGPSGEGKTTLLDLAIGLNTPDSGHIEVDGHPLPDLNMDLWRQKIGYVPQDVLLFHDTIRNNIALNNPDAGDQEIIQALKAAGAWDFVQQTENSLDTVVGERGAKLSGGQRQRIAIARALVKKPSLLILDEATGALDKKTEKEILTTVKTLSKDILVLSISHNPSSLTLADKVFKLQNGKLEALSPQQIAGLAA